MPRSRPRRVSRFRKVPVEGARLECARQHQGVDHASQPDPANQPRPASLRQPPILSRGQRRDLFYGKTTPAKDNIILVALNLDPHRMQSCYIDVPIANLEWRKASHIKCTISSNDERYTWHGRRNYVELDPDHPSGAHISPAPLGRGRKVCVVVRVCRRNLHPEWQPLMMSPVLA